MGAYHEKLYQRPFYEVQAVKGLREALSTTFLRGASSKRS